MHECVIINKKDNQPERNAMKNDRPKANHNDGAIT